MARNRRQRSTRPLAVVGPPITTPIVRCPGRQDHQTPPSDRRQPRTRPIPRTDRIDQHQDPTTHPDRLRVPRPPTPHSPRTTRPRQPPTTTPRPTLTSHIQQESDITARHERSSAAGEAAVCGRAFHGWADCRSRQGIDRTWMSRPAPSLDCCPLDAFPWAPIGDRSAPHRSSRRW